MRAHEVVVAIMLMLPLLGCQAPVPREPTPADPTAPVHSAEECRRRGHIMHLGDLILMPTGHNHPDLAPPEAAMPARVCFHR